VPPPGLPTVLAAFQPYGAVHALAIAASLGGWALFVAWARAVKRRRGARGERILRRAFAVVVWGFNVAWQLALLRPSEFAWGHSLPLHLCDVAWMAAGWSLWCGGDPSRTRHQAPVVWGLSLALLAYAAPAVTADPDGVSFWTFWITHWQILAVALLNLLVFGTRITPRGRAATLLLTVLGCALATAVNLLLDTSYFFTGRGLPENPSPLDWLGAWPLRILWIVLLGAAALSAVATLVARLQRRLSHATNIASP
jgi:hypothetical integral membrane protein (TIGR02206 family)